MNLFYVVAYVIAAFIGAILGIAFVIYLLESGILSYWMHNIDAYYDHIIGIKDFPDYWRSLASR